MVTGRVIAAGEIKSLYPTVECGYDGYTDRDGHFYYPKEIDFRNNGVPLPQSELIIPSIWIARDEDGSLTAFCTKPSRYSRKPFSTDYWQGVCLRSIDSSNFPEITWLTEPVEFEVIFKKKSIAT